MLTISPLASLAALVALVTLGLILTGVVQLAQARTPPTARLLAVAGVSGLAAGVAVLVWPGVTIRVLTVVVGLSLTVGGAIMSIAAVRGAADQRVSLAIHGTVGVIFGILALSWPDVTVFVVAVVFGVPVALFGIAEVVAMFTSAPGDSHSPGGGWWWTAPRRRPKAAAAVVAPAVALVLLTVSAWMHSAAPRPDAFYTPPAVAPAAPGALLRSEPFARGAPAGAQAWRILYTTTRDDHAPAVASALVLAAAHIPPGARPVLAWAHGATGIGRGCAPSLLNDPLGSGAMPGLDQVLAHGWVVVATDYTGLGTAGPHPFLIGQGEARSVLDAVRAARHLTAVTLGDRTVVWGHSQGGNAALWTGILAPTYAPDAGVIGIAALAPGSNLTALAENWGRGEGGVISAAYLVQAYSDTYPDVRFRTYVRPTAEIQIHELAGQCLSESKLYLSGISSLLFGQSIWATDPGTGAFGRRLLENTPTGPIPMPLLVAQGEADVVVTPTTQADYVHARCASGGPVDYRTYPDRTHVGLIAADSPLIADLVRWTQDRLDGKPAGSTCPA